MTSYTRPDYNIDLKVEPHDSRQLSGIAFDVDVTVEGRPNIYNGMLIVPMGNGTYEDSDRREAWLWLDDLKDLFQGVTLCIRIISSCDTMLTHKRIKELRRYSGKEFIGEVKENWNT